jgi:hypothetical protein
MQLTHPHELPRLLGRNATVVVYVLLCLAEMEHIAPVGREWLVDNMPGPVSPYTITQALRVLTSAEVQLVVRVAGGWRVAGKAFQLPFLYPLPEDASENPLDSQDPEDREHPFEEDEAVISPTPCAVPVAAHRRERVSGNPKDSESPKDSGKPFVVVDVESESVLSTITTTINNMEKKASASLKVAESPNEPRFRACLEILREYEVIGRKARQIAELEWVTPEYIRAHMEQVQREQDRWENPTGMALYRIQEHAPLPGKWVRRDADDRSRYISGKYADIIKH